MKIFKWIIKNEWQEKTHDNIIQNHCLINLNTLINKEINETLDKFIKESDINKKEQLSFYINGLQQASKIIINNMQTNFLINRLTEQESLILSAKLHEIGEEFRKQEKEKENHIHW